MRRDMDLIREILLEIESKESETSWVTVSFEGYSEQEVNYHVKLLSQEGLIKAKSYMSGHMIQNLTWQGHDFIEDAKNETVWIKAKEFIKEKGGSASLSVMTEVLKSFALKHFNVE